VQTITQIVGGMLMVTKLHVYTNTLRLEAQGDRARVNFLHKDDSRIYIELYEK
jgi:hypothetical protein